jgi:single-strand DNA-binding protein
VIFNDRLSELAERFLRKGRKVYVQGSLQTRKWTDHAGQERYSTEVVIGFLGDLVLLDSGGGPRDESEAAEIRENAPSGGDRLNDDIPFYPVWRSRTLSNSKMRPTRSRLLFSRP